MDDLAREYWGRVRVARFVVMGRLYEIPSPEIKKKYDITYIPTVILFDKGVEVERWRLVVMEDIYRYDLDKFLKTRPPSRRLAEKPAVRQPPLTAGAIR